MEKVEDKVTEEGSEEEEVVEEEEEEVEDDDEGSDEGSEASAAEEEEETQKGAAKAEKEEDPASEAESDISLTHESLKPTKKKGKKVVYVPPGETKEERDRRTVFIGNVGIDVAKNKVSRSLLELCSCLRSSPLPRSSTHDSPHRTSCARTCCNSRRLRASRACAAARSRLRLRRRRCRTRTRRRRTNARTAKRIVPRSGAPPRREARQVARERAAATTMSLTSQSRSSTRRASARLRLSRAM